MKEKHLCYYSILEAFEVKDCPICYLIERSVEKYFDNLLYENINDVGFNKLFNENKGFCNYHSYKFMSYNDGLAVSLTHKNLVLENIGEEKI